jgi:hypothetical protein
VTFVDERGEIVPAGGSGGGFNNGYRDGEDGEVEEKLPVVENSNLMLSNS